MNMIIGKKQILMASLVAALGLAVFVNWYYTDNVSEDIGPDVQQAAEVQQELQQEIAYVDNNLTQTAEEYFANAKLQRTNARDEAMESLQTVIDSCDASSDAAVAAVHEMSELNTSILLENEVESLVTAKINSECYCRIDENGVDIVVMNDKLNDESVLAISDIIYANCDKVENIRITGA